MKFGHLAVSWRQPWRSAILLLVLVLPIAVAGCGEEEEGTPTAAGTPAATVTAAATPAVGVPGITDTEIILGADSIMTGTLATVYSTIPETVETYFNYINDTEGGVCGRKIVYKREDSGDDPAKALEAVRKLVEEEKVFAIVSSQGENAHTTVFEYLNEKGVPDLFFSAGADIFGADPQGYPWSIPMIPSFKIEGAIFGKYISENLPGKKIAVLWENSPIGIDGLAGLKEGLDPSKNEIVADESYEPTAVSVASQVNNLKGSGAEAMVLYSSPGFTAQAITQADRLGWHPQWIMSYVNSDEMIFQFVPPELLDGAVTFQAFKMAAWRDDPAVARHYELMQKYGGPSPTNFTVYAQTLAELAVEALKRSCDNLTREGLMDAAESIKDWHSDVLMDGVNVTLSETDHVALQTLAMMKIAVVDGKGKFEYFGRIYSFEE